MHKHIQVCCYYTETTQFVFSGVTSKKSKSTLSADVYAQL